MKKSLIALAVLAAAGAASAQSSVTLFGVVDAALAIGRADGVGSADRTRLVQGAYNSSRLGFRGTEDLGGGMSASFWLEAGLNNDDGSGLNTSTNNQLTGATGGGGLTFNRRSTVSLAGGWGEVRVGRDYTPQFWNLTVFDPFGTNGVGTTQALLGVTVPLAIVPGVTTAPANTALPGSLYPVQVRASNSIGYFLPGNLGGFYGQAQYYLGENARTGAATEDDGNGWGVRAGFANGPFNVAIAASKTDYAFAGDIKTINVGGQWDFGVAKLLGHFNRDRSGGSAVLPGSTGKGWLLGTLVPVGAGEIRASYSTYELEVAGTEPTTRKLAIGYVHNLSKRTAVYTTYARVRNRDGAATTLNGSTVAFGTVNQSSSGLDIGLRHSF